MIVYVNSRLVSWAEWVASGRKVVGLGYPSQCAYTRMAAHGGQHRGAEFDEDAWEVEQAVNRLDNDLQQMVMEFYLSTTTVEIMARNLHCHRDTVYARLHRAHHEILGHLNDIAAGIDA